MKMRTENTKGDAESYRDQADFTVAPPKLALVKGAIQTNKPAGLPPWPMPNNPGLDTQTVQQGSTTTFQIDVKNNEPATPAGAGSTQSAALRPGTSFLRESPARQYLAMG